MFLHYLRKIKNVFDRLLCYISVFWCLQKIGKGRLYFDFKSVTHLYSCFHFNKEQYGCETWSSVKYLCARLDAFDMWAIWKILQTQYTPDMRLTLKSGILQPASFSSDTVTNRRLRLFGHITHGLDLLIKINTIQSQWQVTIRSHCLTGNGQQQDPVIPCYVRMRT